MKDVKSIIKLTLVDLDLWDIDNENLEQESILEYLLDEINELSTESYDMMKLKSKINDCFEDFGLNGKYDSDEQIVEKFSRVLSTRLFDNQSYGDEVPEEVDVFAKHTCELCKRICPLTFHHLIPKETHSQMLKKGLFDKEYMRTHGANICRMCHSAVHRTFSNKRLALEFNTVEKLSSNDDIQKWIKFAERQKVRIKYFRSI
ncbi:hypothetical protein K502DRAFT_143255 [Neoconidiobolus thromboides FSU 785]|nr:hypothetical protein K502DRAFT_143255 [Neoconidiobolus thromboides FSU 785]